MSNKIRNNNTSNPKPLFSTTKPNNLALKIKNVKEWLQNINNFVKFCGIPFNTPLNMPNLWLVKFEHIENISKHTNFLTDKHFTSYQADKMYAFLEDSMNRINYWDTH